MSKQRLQKLKQTINDRAKTLNAQLSSVQFSRSVMFDSVIPWTVACQAPHPWNFPSKNTGKGCHFLLQGIFPTPGIEPMSLVPPALAGRFFTPVLFSIGGGGLVAKLCPSLATPWTAAFQAPLSMGFSRQESWSG